MSFIVGFLIGLGLTLIDGLFIWYMLSRREHKYDYLIDFAPEELKNHVWKDLTKELGDE